MALSADRDTKRRDGNLFEIDVAASTTIYAGSIVARNSSGYAVPASADVTLKTLGRAEKQKDNSSGSAGDLAVQIRRGIFNFASDTGDGAITAANIGQPCYAKDDQTVSLYSGAGTYPYAGIIDDYNSTDGVWVDMRRLKEPDFYVSRVAITAAQIKLLATTQITLVGAPGAGKILVLENAVLQLDYGSEVLAEPSAPDELQIKYTDDSGAAVSNEVDATGFITATADTTTIAYPIVNPIAAVSASANKPFVLDNTGGNYTGNASDDTVLDVWVTYKIVKL